VVGLGIEDSRSGEDGERSRTRRAGRNLGDGLGELATRRSEVEFCEVLLDSVGVPNDRLLRGVRCEASGVERDSCSVLLWLSRAECRRGGESGLS
jgi:hypothetical protein